LKQGKKALAHRSASPKTHNRGELPGACSTMCGAHRLARPGRRALRETRAGRRPVRPTSKRQRHRAFILVAFPQQALSD